LIILLKCSSGPVHSSHRSLRSFCCTFSQVLLGLCS
jgi:hypothetical protein